MKRHSDLQYGFSDEHPEAVLNAPARVRKADKILRILEDQGIRAGEARLLEMGCGAGFMTRRFAEFAHEVVAVDIDQRALAIARAQNSGQNVAYALMDAQRLALPDESFDVIVCNHVYEHVPDARRLMDEVRRLLRPAGCCYFGAGNRLALMEPHYRLPLLSVVPKGIAHPYLRWFRSVDRYYETHRTYWGLRDLVADFQVTDYTLRVIADPARFAADDLLRPASLRRWAIERFVKHCYWLCPTYLWVLRRRDGAPAPRSGTAHELEVAMEQARGPS